MGRTNSKVVWAGAFVGCAVAMFALKAALATPGLRISTTILAGPSLLDEIHLKTKNDDYGADHEVEVKTKGVSDVYVVRNVIAPGGHAGWHSHPGPSIISVVSGVATEYHGDETEGTVHPKGTAFVDDGDGAHIVRNEGDTDLELIAFQILPADAPRRIDEPQP